MSDVEQRDAIEFLADPATYGVGDVQRIDTHASSVFLAGDVAYKLKRAVKFGYLDFTSRARRRLACAAEVSINRRFAPELYRGVRTIRRTADGTLQFDGPGKAIDWVVEMRRFDTNEQLDVVAQRNQLTRAMMLAVATRLASMHAHAPVAADERTPYVEMRPLLAGVEQELDRFARFLDAPKVALWRDWMRETLPALEPLLSARHDDGRVRWCHGDLHLANWCLLEGKPVPFDALEFSRALATCDVLYDLAFPLMDLAHHGRLEAANAVFNRYLDFADEEGGLAALPFFQSLRAAIRAHVLAAAAERQSERHKRDRLAAAAHAYLVTAIEFQRPRAPRLIAIGGFSGSGKSSIAHEMAPCLGLAPGARVLRSDVLRKQLHGAGRHQHLPASAYGETADREVYQGLRTAAAAALARGCTVIVDAVFARPGDRTALRETAEQAGVPFTGLWLEAPDEVLRSRLQHRPRGVSDADLHVLHQQLRRGHGLLDWHRIDTVSDMSACRRTALRTAELHHAA